MDHGDGHRTQLDWEWWLRTWDRQQELLLPDREERLSFSKHAPEGELDWGDWWKAAATEPVLAPLVAERNKRFKGEIHPPEFTPPLRWHEEALRAAGFREAGCRWRRGAAAIVAAIR